MVVVVVIVVVVVVVAIAAAAAGAAIIIIMIICPRPWQNTKPHYANLKYILISACTGRQALQQTVSYQ